MNLESEEMLFLNISWTHLRLKLKSFMFFFNLWVTQYIWKVTGMNRFTCSSLLVSPLRVSKHFIPHCWQNQTFSVSVSTCSSSSLNIYIYNVNRENSQIQQSGLGVAPFIRLKRFRCLVYHLMHITTNRSWDVFKNFGISLSKVLYT